MAKEKKGERHNQMQQANWTIGQNADSWSAGSKAGRRRNISRQQNMGPFINPYNFVRVEHTSRSMDRLPFLNTHERFHNGCLSGRLKCRLEVISPLFVSDPEKRESSPKGGLGKSLLFNRDHNQQPCIPATSLKGMIRNVLEAVSNSCFAQLNMESLDYRDVQISQDLKPALVTDTDKGQNRAKIVFLDDMAWLPAYPSTRDMRNDLYKKNGPPFFAYTNIKKNRYIVKCRLKRDLIDQEKQAIVRLRKRYKASGNEKRFRAENLSQSDKDVLQEDLQRLCQGRIQVIRYNVVSFPLQDDLLNLPSPRVGEEQYQVLIKHTGKTIPNKKHDERVFFSETFKTDLAENLGSFPPRQISYDRIRDMDYILNEQYHHCSRQEGKAKAEEGVRMRLNRGGIRGLQKGDLVYYYNKKGKEHLALVLVPRLRYTTAPSELLPSHLRPCTNLDALCPACRIFGMVSEGGKVGFKGRVSFSDAVSISEELSFKKGVLLKILGAPCPTSTNFYLIGKSYDNTDVVTVKKGGYDKGKVILRGRKFYWQQADKEHPLDPESYQKKEFAEATNFDKRVELLLPKVDFSFDVDFENLTRDELSLLVWSLELEDEMCHRLGMGKPLGLGTVRVKIQEDESFIVDHDGFKKYYCNIEQNIAEIRLSVGFSKLKEEAKTKLQGTKAYDDLKSILAYNKTVADRIRYPKKMKKISGKWQPLGYAWFQDNRDQPLYTIKEIVQGRTQAGWEGGNL